MSFFPKSGFLPESSRGSEEKPSNLYTGVFGDARLAAEADSSPAPVKDITTLARSIQELANSNDFNFEEAVSFSARELLKFFAASGVAIAIERGGGIVCCASAGETAPEVGTVLNIASGISGVCFRTGQSQYCHDARRDERVNYQSCHALGILSILISPVIMGERTVGLVEVFSPEEFFFDRNDIATLERIAALMAQLHERTLLRPMVGQKAQVLPSRDVLPAIPMAMAVAAAASGSPAMETMTTAGASVVPAKPTDIASTVLLPTIDLTQRAQAQPVRVFSSASRQRNRKRNTSVLLILAALVVLVGGGLATRTLLQRKSAANVVAIAQPVSISQSNSAKTLAAGSEIPVSMVPAGKVADKKPSSSISAADAQPKVPAVKAAPPPQVVDLLASGANPREIPQRSAAATDVAAEAPSLGSVAMSGPPASLVSSLASVGPAPKLTRTPRVEAEVLIYKVAPSYPAMARSAHVEGEVLVRFTIAKDGSVKNPIIEKGHSMLRGAVLVAVQQWKYKPYTVDGEAREVQALVSVKFH